MKTIFCLEIVGVLLNKEQLLSVNSIVEAMSPL